jgi:hypothetical protein
VIVRPIANSVNVRAARLPITIWMPGIASIADITSALSSRLPGSVCWLDDQHISLDVIQRLLGGAANQRF